MNPTRPDALRVRKALWLANLTAVMVIACVIYFLPGVFDARPLPAAATVVLWLAVLSIPVAFLARRLTGLPVSGPPGRGAAADDPARVRKETSRYAVAGTLAELPALFGLVYAVVGGDALFALLFAAASLAATLALRPE